MKPLYAAIDIGTFAVKCVAIVPGTKVRVCVIGLVPIEVKRPTSGAAEIDPREVLQAVRQLLTKLFYFATQQQRNLEVIGLTGHIGGAVAVNAHGQALAAMTLWQDQRCSSEAAEYVRLGSNLRRQHCGVVLPRSVGWSAPRLRWLVRNHPVLIKRAWKIMQIQDYVFFHLTGESWSEPRIWLSLANLHTGQFSSAMLEWCGVRETQLPRLHSADDGLPMRPSRELRITLPAGMSPQIGVGTADYLSAYLGCGLSVNQAAMLANTSENIGVVVTADHAATTPAGIVRLTYGKGCDLLYGSTTNGGSSVEWARTVLGGVPLSQLFSEAAQVPPGSDGLLFIPHLLGERAPIWDETRTGTWLGIRANHGRGHLFRAVLEGCAYSKRHVLTTAKPEASHGRQPIMISGGSARSTLWNQIRAGVLGRAMVPAPTTEMSALGAALLTTQSRDADWAKRFRVQAAQTPLRAPANWIRIYQQGYARYVHEVTQHAPQTKETQ